MVRRFRMAEIPATAARFLPLKCLLSREKGKSPQPTERRQAGTKWISSQRGGPLRPLRRPFEGWGTGSAVMRPEVAQEFPASGRGLCELPEPAELVIARGAERFGCEGGELFQLRDDGGLE